MRFLPSTILLIFTLLTSFCRLTCAAQPSTQAAEQDSIGVYGGYVHPHWNSVGTEFWYESFGKGLKHEFWWVNAISGQRHSAFDCNKLAAELEKSGVVSFDPDFVVLNDMQELSDGRLRLNLAGNQFVYDPVNNAVKFECVVTSLPRPLPRLQSIIASHEHWETTTITFVNEEKVRGSLWSVDGIGNQRRMDDLQPGWTEYPAYVGSVFAVKDEHGALLAVYEAVADPSQAQIRSALAIPATQPLFGGQSGNGKWIVKAYDSGIWILDKNGHQEMKLVANCGNKLINLTAPARIESSADSSRIFAVLTNYEGQVGHLIQSSPNDQLQPRLLETTFVRAIDPVWSDEPQLIDPVNRVEIPIDQKIFPRQFDIRQCSWDANSTRMFLSCVDRGKRIVQLIVLDGVTGETKELLEEKSDSFVDVSSSEKCKLIMLPATKEFLWTSERDGWNHVYLYDATSGKLKNQITRGSWVVRDFLQIHPISRTLLLKVGGIAPEEDPYNIHVCRINFDGSGLIDLTPSDGSHSIQFSPDGQFYIDTYSRVDLPPVSELRRTRDAKLICTIEKGDWSERLKHGWSPPEPFVAKGRDGKTDIYGVIYRPLGFNPSKKYPVIESIYAGPQGASVPKEFDLDTMEMRMANYGFIVVQIDGMGTNYRSKAFHDLCWHNLADAGFPDRIAWIKAAAIKNPEIDLSRVGIFGGSAGAVNAVRGLENYGDFYTVAVAECGSYDYRLAAQSEDWMGWPVGQWYAEQSAMNAAAKISGKLLLISCELDHVVDPAATMQMVGALIKADKDFDLLIVPNADHGQIGEYGFRKYIRFFAQNLSMKMP